MTGTKIQMTQAGTPAATHQPLAAVVAMDTARVYAEVGGSIESVRTEINDAFEDMKTFINREPDEIMRLVAGHSARLSEIRVRIQRIEDVHRLWKNVRTREVEPTLDQLGQQFTIASRLHSVREFDYAVETGERR